MIRERLTKQQILTVPNVMSLFRLLLIPVYLYLYRVQENYDAAIAVIVVSALTDIADGWIARKFNMISDFGKFLDPVADKLTQTAVLLSLCARYRQLFVLFGLFAAKEITMLVVGSVVLKKTNTINSAKWYGKMGTVVLELALVLLILVPQMPLAWVKLITLVCCAVMVFVLVMYQLFYLRLLREAAKPAAEQDPSE